MSNEFKRSCVTCKFSALRTCETLKNNNEYMELAKEIEGETFMARDLRKYEFKEKFICDKYKSRYIEYPIEVSKINKNTEKRGLRDSEIGKFAKISPCGKEYEGKTYLGLFLGDLPIGNHVSHNNETKELNISFSTNPAIFVFDLKKIIYGCESWWGIIEKEEDLKDITDKEINNIWYVKALKSLSQGEGTDNNGSDEGEELQDVCIK